MSSENSIRQYQPELIEEKWQKRWERDKTWVATKDASQKKFYVLDMFPYPSGRLHMGHVRNYTLGDVIGRFRKSQGYNVLHPMGWDAFGLPAENAAIKRKVHPQKWTLENIQNMKVQFKRLGLGYDWNREIATCLPEYYRWEQKIFVQMFKKGLAYKKSSTVNWCPSCNTVLANEQVENGKCWRCESEVTTKELEQWFLKTTQYAQELLEGLDQLPGWPERVRAMQKNWIGKSQGAEVQFGLESGEEIKVFTTRPDTLMGVTYMAIAPESTLATELCKGKPEEKEVLAFVDKCRKEDKIKRTAEDAPKEGVFTGAYAIHPLNQKKIPIYVANFVLMDYGTGALMAVPAHDVRDHMFAKKYKIEIEEVIRPEDGKSDVQAAAFTEAGVMVNSGEFDGLDWKKGKKAVIKKLESINKGKGTVNYRLRDWGLSRQRYWGSPIPMIHCRKCGPVPVPEDELPVVLPDDVEFTGEGGSPLLQHPDFVKTKCPDCGMEDARRETDTMDTFMESSWYYLRYLSPKDDTQAFDPSDAGYWLPIDQYIGGVEHATMHLLYFRFFHRVLRDLGYFPNDLPAETKAEPAKNLLNQGIVYKDGSKMSKSKGNVVEPDSIIGKYGADTARLFMMFAAPPEKVLEWSDQGVEGSYRFINRVWRMVESNLSIVKEHKPYSGPHKELSHDPTKKLRAKTHQTIDKVTRDFENGYHFNTAIAAVMELVNELYSYKIQMGNDQCHAVLRESLETAVRLIHPFVPHVTEELWERLGHEESLANVGLPKTDPEALVKDVVTIIVQINGKLRGNMEAAVNLEKDQVIEMSKEVPKIQGYLEGKEIVKTIYVPKKLVNFVVK